MKVKLNTETKTVSKLFWNCLVSEFCYNFILFCGRAYLSANSTWLVTSRHASTRHDTFDVSSASRRAYRAVLVDKLDNAWARHVERVVWRVKWNLGFTKATYNEANHALWTMHHATQTASRGRQESHAPFKVSVPNTCSGSAWDRDRSADRGQLGQSLAVHWRPLDSRSLATS